MWSTILNCHCTEAKNGQPKHWWRECFVFSHFCGYGKGGWMERFSAGCNQHRQHLIGTRLEHYIHILSQWKHPQALSEAAKLLQNQTSPPFPRSSWLVLARLTKSLSTTAVGNVIPWILSLAAVTFSGQRAVHDGWGAAGIGGPQGAG